MNRPQPTLSRSLSVLVTAAAAALSMTACGGKKDAEAATQVAARVNESDVTVHQLNYRLQQDRSVRPEQANEASYKLLEKLIDQELAIQKAEQLKLDRDPRVVQALDAARRDVLARAYIDSVVQPVPAPADDAVRRYFDQNPALFSERRVYVLTEMLAQVPADKAAALKSMVSGGKTLDETVAWFKGEAIKFNAKTTVAPAEVIPLGELPALAKLPDGRGMVAVAGPVFKLVFVNSSKQEPASFEQAKPSITQFLHNDARRKTAEANLQALRTTGSVEYKGKFVSQAASQPVLGTTGAVNPAAQITAASGAKISLPTTTASGTQVSLP
ncbi:EpsD family peptidyl-prolyl cis-trans isomerase, partial [Ideonella sp.]|uniref:EpsD family peptidyl-prolyl cis-trans isomerase n=1 Tax=Ideonella sp. TaxID=1929293 RepID=UPI003BB7446F